MHMGCRSDEDGKSFLNKHRNIHVVRLKSRQSDDQDDDDYPGEKKVRKTDICMMNVWDRPMSQIWCVLNLD